MKSLKLIKNNWKNLLLSIFITMFLISLGNFQVLAADLEVSLSYRERIALGSEAEARLMIVDPSKTEANFTIKDLSKKLKGVPTNFKFNLSEKEINAAQNYQLLALIKSGRNMIWSENKNFSGEQLLEQKKIELLTRRIPARFLAFSGEKDFEVKFFKGLAQVIIDDKEYILPQQRTASGAKFANSEISIWNKGRKILLEKDNHNYQAALISLSELDAKQSRIKARGQEPYWEFELNKNNLELKYDYLTNKIIIPRENIKILKKGNSLVYQVKTTFLDFELKILEEIHRDAMNAKLYPLTAFVKINGKKYIGGADLQ